MRMTRAGLAVAFAVVATTFGCAGMSSLLTTSWSENYANADTGSQASHPYLNDGKLSTVAMTPNRADPREFILKFDGERQVRRIKLTNDNLYRFKVAYWDGRREIWRDVQTVRQRRDVEGAERVIQPLFVFGKLNFRTDRIRIEVTRTVDDIIVTKSAPGPNDTVIEHGFQNISGRQREYFRILIESPARVREVEVYGIDNKPS
jgi:hypothetical protein